MLKQRKNAKEIPLAVQAASANDDVLTHQHQLNNALANPRPKTRVL